MFTVLIVDDNPADRNGIHELVPWLELGMRVIGKAADGQEGLEKARELRPDFILTDVSMPELDGIQLASEIRKEMPETGIVFMSCFDDFNYVKSALNLEAHGYVLKPIELEELIAVLNKMRDVRKAQLERIRIHHDLAKKISESLPERRERYFERLLLHQPGNAEIRHKMTELEMNPKVETCIVIYIYMDDYDLVKRSNSLERRSMLSQTIRDKTERVILSRWDGIIIYQEFNGLAGILFDDTSDIETFKLRVVDSVQRFHSFMSDQMLLNITIAVTEPTSDFSLIPVLYEQAREMAGAKFYHGGGRIVQKRDIPPTKRTMDINVQEIRQKLVRLLEQKDEQKKEDFLNQLFSPEYPGSERTFKGLALSVLNLLQTILLEKDESLLPVVGDLGQLLQKIEQFETINEIRVWLGNILTEIADRLNSESGKRYMQIVKDIHMLIDSRYSTDLTAEQIADRLHLSVSHANAIFKQHTGQSIFESIVQRKLEAAKQMLHDPYVKIYEVAEKVGYKNKSYFSALFKEYTGLSPRQYMDLHSERRYGGLCHDEEPEAHERDISPEIGTGQNNRP